MYENTLFEGSKDLCVKFRASYFVEKVVWVGGEEIVAWPACVLKEWWIYPCSLEWPGVREGGALLNYCAAPASCQRNEDLPEVI